MCFKPLVICLGVGTGAGPRTGMTPLADMLNSMAERNNVVVVVPIGNEGNARTHVQDVLVSNTGVSEININVGGLDYEQVHKAGYYPDGRR